ncbi:membrane-bound metal-dependent hydrolase [Ferroglobus placidus DSM 10642]|uniref:Membrane-bound metal-dependent hydrolase n=1 Tax=Ferroglobus placidus (strain DSM 10642 / AEDII12DO) TaxID=589924 RepID=D3S0N3_FERPA|nr:metal-dependent hydrolase [Ferroglobus placidus]ADC66274.1 membrane-bound metal-dependent hydrolase [Ferroglobus placidus DSM 10642]
MLKITHVVFPVALASFLTKDANFLFATGLFGILSDIDVLLKIKHRGFTHSLLFLFLILYLVYIFDRSLLIFAFIGLTSHIFLDSLTKSGVQLFYPAKRRFRILTFRYDSVILNTLIILLSLYILKKNGVVDWRFL